MPCAIITIQCRRNQREHESPPATAVDNRAPARQDIALEDSEVDWISQELSTSELRACPADTEVPGRGLSDKPGQGGIERPAPHNAGDYHTT